MADSTAPAALPRLAAADFGAFFSAVHSRPDRVATPFPWQTALLERIAAEDGRWPDLLDLPTGVGKTAAIDVAIFHLAVQAGQAQRTAPLRVVFVVDRRTIVDQAWVRATKISDAIEQAKDGVLASVRARLKSLSRDGEGQRALEVALLRGGIPRIEDWAKQPDRPVVAVSTVDQVGSRLLFRGYGVSDGMKPLHAGLLGNDVLWLLDEVHLSEPFRETLEAIGGRFRHWGEDVLTAPFAVVEMSATPGRAPGRAVFGLTANDHDNPILRRRLEAKKPVP